MSCFRCGSERIFQFEAKASTPIAAADLPRVCRDCGVIAVGDEVLDLPEVLSRPVTELAEEALAKGKEGRQGLEKLAQTDSAARIEGYMSSFYKAAYLDGFFRALVFFRHHAKEGRLYRLRELWKKIESKREENGAVVVSFRELAYKEFCQLLFLSISPGEFNASRNPHKRSTAKEDRS